MRGGPWFGFQPERLLLGRSKDRFIDLISQAMPVVMHLACVTLRMSMEEALVAATLNAAHSLGRGATHGALAPGRKGDVLVVDAPSWQHLIYQLGNHNRLITAVIKDGRVVHQNMSDS